MIRGSTAEGRIGATGSTLGYGLGDGPEPAPGIAHRIGVPAPSPTRNSSSRPARSGYGLTASGCNHLMSDPWWCPARYPPLVVGGSDAEPGNAGSGGEVSESVDALWVRNFLITQPGKTYRVESTDDAREAAATHAVEAAARVLTDEVVRSARVDGQVHPAAPDQPF